MILPALNHTSDISSCVWVHHPLRVHYTRTLGILPIYAHLAVVVFVDHGLRDAHDHRRPIRAALP